MKGKTALVMDSSDAPVIITRKRQVKKAPAQTEEELLRKKLKPEFDEQARYYKKEYFIRWNGEVLRANSPGNLFQKYINKHKSDGKEKIK